MAASTVSSAGAVYDKIPYLRTAFPQSHPHTLCAMARLFGLDAPDPARARVLELGCAEGANLLPMAQHAPGAQFLGIDASARQITAGQATIAATRLTNVELRRQDIMDFSAADGKFDYIIVHGVFSWVREPVREKILAICHDQLTVDGVAFVSYNARPGWNLRGCLRDMVKFYAADMPESWTPAARFRAFGTFLAETLPVETDPFGRWLLEEVKELSKHHDGYLAHEFLGETNQPFYFFEFMQHATRAGLRYLGEPVFKRMLASVSTPAAAKTLAQLNVSQEAREQYLDFVSNRMFRETLLCHPGRPLVRAVQPAVIKSFHFSSNLLPPAPGSLDLTPGRLQGFKLRGPAIEVVDATESLLKAAMDTLAHLHHGRISFTELLASARKRIGSAEELAAADEQLLAENLLNLYVSGLVEIHADGVPIKATPSARPVATALARYEAAHFTSITNLAHKTVAVDPLGRHMIRQCDGAHDAGAIVESLCAAIAAGEFGQLVENNVPMTNPAAVRAFITNRMDAMLQSVANFGFFLA